MEVEQIIAIAGISINSNRAIRELAKKNPEKIHWIYGYHPDISQPSLVEGIGLNKGDIAGIKIYPGYQNNYPTDQKFESIYRTAEAHDVPVIFHSGDTWDHSGRIKYAMPIHIDDVAVNHPDMKIVIAHIGNPFIREAAAVANKNPNVYIDFSGMTSIMFDERGRYSRRVAEDVQWTIDFLGKTDKIMYGSDWPLIRMKPYFELFKNLDISQLDREKMFYKNAKNLFKL